MTYIFWREQIAFWFSDASRASLAIFAIGCVIIFVVFAVCTLINTFKEDDTDDFLFSPSVFIFNINILDKPANSDLENEDSDESEENNG